jgi:hypothetical protein
MGMPAYEEWSDPGMKSQNELSKVTFKDSYEYASAFDP